MSTARLRCRYQVWSGGRGIVNSQCWFAAKMTRILRLRPTKTLPERREELPVCGTHANAVDRDPRAWHSAYEWDGSPYSAAVEEHLTR